MINKIDGISQVSNNLPAQVLSKQHSGCNNVKSFLSTATTLEASNIHI